MIIPVRCFTCGKVKREYDVDAKEDGEAPGERWTREGKEDDMRRSSRRRGGSSRGCSGARSGKVECHDNMATWMIDLLEYTA
jgi:hypothetical protein